MEDKIWKCERCGENDSSTKSNLLKHLRRIKPCPPNLSNISPEDYIEKLLHREYNEKTYDCEYCNTKFNSRSNKSRHKTTCKAKQEFEGIDNILKQSNRIDELALRLTALEQQKNNDTLQLQRNNSQLNVQIKEKDKTIQELQKVVENLTQNNKTMSEEQDASFEASTSAPTKKKKTKIPQSKRILCWNTYIGEEIGKTKCPCCQIMDISPFAFQCGHVVSDAKGGDTSIENLRPICDKCNNDMGTTDMREFAMMHFGTVI